MIRPSSAGVIDLHFVRPVPVVVYAQRLVHAEVYRSNLSYGCGAVCVPGGFREMDEAVLWTPHHSLTHKGKKKSYRPADMYAEVKHCLPNDVIRSGTCWATNEFIF